MLVGFLKRPNMERSTGTCLNSHSLSFLSLYLVMVLFIYLTLLGYSNPREKKKKNAPAFVSVFVNATQQQERPMITTKTQMIDGQLVVVKVCAYVAPRITHYTKTKGSSARGGWYVAQQSSQILKCEVCGVKITRQQEAGGGR